MHAQPDHPLVAGRLAERRVELAQADRLAAAEAGEGVVGCELGDRPRQVDGEHHVLGQRRAAHAEGDQHRDQASQQHQQAADTEHQVTRLGHDDLHSRAIVTRIAGFAAASARPSESLALGSDAAGNPWLFAFSHGRGAWRVALGRALAAPRTPRGRLSP